MENTNCQILQNRWKVEGTLLKYYGLRNYPYTLRRTIRLSNREVRLRGYSRKHFEGQRIEGIKGNERI